MRNPPSGSGGFITSFSLLISALALRMFMVLRLALGDDRPQLLDLVKQVRHGRITHRISAVEDKLRRREVAVLGLGNDHLENFRHVRLEHGPELRYPGRAFGPACGIAGLTAMECHDPIVSCY